MSAVIQISIDFEEVRSLISVRSDIWHTVTVVKRLGTDRLDKIQTPVTLSFSEEEIGEIFFKRLALANAEIDGKNSKRLENFFSEPNIILPGKTETIRPWHIWIQKQSRNKPRDMVQLIQQLIEEADNNGSSKISNSDAHKIMTSFGQERIKNISREYGNICPQIEFIIQTVSTQTLYPFQVLFEKLKLLPSMSKITIDGLNLASNKAETALKILKVLHMANFINAKRTLSDGSYEHYMFSEFPDLIQEGNVNDLQVFEWEIHPVFHNYVANIVKNQSFFR